MTSLFSLVFICNCVATALAAGNTAVKGELTGMHSGYKVNEGAA